MQWIQKKKENQILAYCIWREFFEKRTFEIPDIHIRQAHILAVTRSKVQKRNLSTKVLYYAHSRSFTVCILL